jgi:hypothetical protein
MHFLQKPAAMNSNQKKQGVVEAGKISDINQS